MEREHLEAFIHRDRTAVERLKRDHWIEQYRRHGGLATMRAAHQLYEHARRLRPDFPGQREMEIDLAHHVELKRRLDRTADALSLS